MVAVLGQALGVTGFVLVMMLVIEVVHVFTGGIWQERLARSLWGQYLLAAALGAMPGCLGAFLVVGMYTHGLLGLGAVVTAMIATSGDESFVMLAMIPRTALLLTAALAAIGIVAGALTDLFAGRRENGCVGLQLHEHDECRCLEHGQILRQLRSMSLSRGALIATLALFVGAVAAGRLGPQQWNWMRMTMVGLTGLALAIVATAPEHFLEEHLWDHVVRRHLLRIFAWTFGALLAMHVLTEHLELGEVVRENPLVVLGVACLVGLIPESGPHLIFVTLYADHAVPFGILLASSIVQDGHGMLPMLAHSRRTFLQIKGINLGVGMLVGAGVLLLGG